jgi:hypothetical protein
MTSKLTKVRVSPPTTMASPAPVFPKLLAQSLPLALLIMSTAALRAQQPKSPSPDCPAATASVGHPTMDHETHMRALANCAAVLPTMPGQAAFAAIGEVVRILEADPNTDWSKVNIEALRQHLIDMDEITMRSDVSQRPVAGGLEMTVTGTGRTIAAIRHIALNHATMLDAGADYHAVAHPTANGAIVTVTAKNPADSRMVSQIRGLGFVGLLTEGDHHAAHHIAIARGVSAPHAP